MKSKNNFVNIQGIIYSKHLISNNILYQIYFISSFPIHAPSTSDYIKKQLVNIINNKQQQPLPQQQPQLTVSPNQQPQQIATSIGPAIQHQNDYNSNNLIRSKINLKK